MTSKINLSGETACTAVHHVLFDNLISFAAHANLSQTFHSFRIIRLNYYSKSDPNFSGM